MTFRQRRALGVESRIKRAARVAIITLVATVGTIALSPLILAGLAEIPGVHWEDLSTIGQSYNGISAVLAAAALTGVVATVRLQARQSLVQQEQAIRATQFELAKLALEDDDLLAATQLRVSDGASRTQRRQHLYLTIRLRHLEFMFVATGMSIRTLELTLTDEFFSNAHALAYWPRVRAVWMSQLAEGRPRHFVETVDRIFGKVSSSRSGPTGVSGVEGGRSSIPPALDDDNTGEMNETVNESNPPPDPREPSIAAPDAAAIRRALAECMTLSDIDEAMGWAPGTARRRRWHAPAEGGLPPADAELAGTSLWLRGTISHWRARQQDTTRPPVALPSAQALPRQRDEAMRSTAEQPGSESTRAPGIG